MSMTPMRQRAQTRTRARRRAAGPMGGALVAVALLLGACSGSEPAPSASAGPATTASAAHIDGDSDGDSDSITIPSLKDEPIIELITTEDPAAVPIPTTPPPTTTAPDSASPQQTATSPTTNFDDPVTTTDSQAPSTSSAGVSSTTTSLASAQPSAQPVAFPAAMTTIRGGEQILLIDTTTGTARILKSFSLAVDPENQIGPQFPFSVDIDPAGGVIRYDTCCGVDTTGISQIDLVTGQTSAPISGSLPSASPDGSLLAMSDLSSVTIVAVASGTSRTLERSGDVWFIGRTAWSPDGQTLAVEVQSAAGSGPVLALLHSDATSLDEALIISPGQGLAWTLPSYRADGSLVVLETSTAPGATSRIVAVDGRGIVVDVIGLSGVDTALDIDHDASGSWLVIVDGSGDAFWFGPSGAGRLPGSGYTSASW